MKAGTACGGCGRLPAAAPAPGGCGCSAVRERGEKKGGEGGERE